MRFLVAGATGAVRRNLLPRLIAAGHQVVGTTRTEAKVPLIWQLGGEALVADRCRLRSERWELDLGGRIGLKPSLSRPAQECQFLP
jgi:nucleoside-diphosphate-sugar epimerase